MNDELTQDGQQTSAPLQVAFDLAFKLSKDVQLAAHQLLPASTEERIVNICQALERDTTLLTTRGVTDVTPIAVLGKVGAGKSWLVRSLVNESQNTNNTRSWLNPGQDAENRTSKNRWLGTEQPNGLSDDEEFRQVPAEQMLALGRPYVVGDTPGFSDANPRFGQLSQWAACSSAVKIIVVDYAEIQDASISDYLTDIDGSIVLLVVKFRPPTGEHQPPEVVKLHVKELCRDWRQHHPAATILAPVYMPMAGISGEREAAEIVRAQLRDSLTGVLSNDGLLRHAAAAQLRERLRRARAELAACLVEVRARLKGPVERLESRLQSIPRELIDTLLGDEMTAMSVVRRRLLADLLDRTPGWCFPYRTLVGLLVLTAGMWSRVIMALSGSVTSLVMAATHLILNVRAGANDGTSLDGLRKRFEHGLSRHIRQELGVFRQALCTVKGRNDAAEYSGVASVSTEGLDRITAEASVVLQRSVSKHRVGGGFVILSTTAGMSLFWCLLAPTAWVIYANYLKGCRLALSGDLSALENFSKLQISALGGSIALSTVPTLLLAMAAVAWSARREKVLRVLESMRLVYKQLLDGLTKEHLFVATLANENLEAANVLLKAGNLADPI